MKSVDTATLQHGRKNLFAFNTKLLSKRCGLIDENGNLLKAARVPKN